MKLKDAIALALEKQKLPPLRYDPGSEARHNERARARTRTRSQQAPQVLAFAPPDRPVLQARRLENS